MARATVPEMVSSNLIGWHYMQLSRSSKVTMKISADFFLVEPLADHTIIVVSTISDKLAWHLKNQTIIGGFLRWVR